MKTKKNSLPVIVVPILKGQYLSDIPDLNPIPTNKIVNKKLPNLGATHGEINVEHHSIIIELNIPSFRLEQAKNNVQSLGSR